MDMYLINVATACGSPCDRQGAEQAKPVKGAGTKSSML